MSVSYLGSVTVGAAIPGLSIALTDVGQALNNLKVVCDAQLSALASAYASVNGQASAVLSAKVAIRVPAVADFQASLDAALDINASLTADLTDPALYFSGLLEGLAEVQVNISSLVPELALQGQIDANVGISAELELKIEAVDLQLALLDSIAIAISAAAGAVLAIQIALSAAVAAVLGALSLFVSVTGVLGGAGVHAFLYTGTVANIGTSLDAAISADTGFAGGLAVRMPFFVYDAANAPAVQGMQVAISVAGA